MRHAMAVGSRRNASRAWFGGCALALCLSASATPSVLDEESYAQALARHTTAVGDTAGTRVDYRALSGSDTWKKVIESLASSNPATLESRSEKLAFWINAYNILTIDLVRRNLPLESIRDLGSLLSPVWKKEAGTIGGRPYMLDEIEHGILRPMGDPRIHAALVCASTSCPSLLREPWRAAAIDEQLDRGMADFLADPKKGARFEPAGDILFLSSIFRWFRSDFETAGGSLHFVRLRLPTHVQEQVEAVGDALKVEFMAYDWSLNTIPDHGSGDANP